MFWSFFLITNFNDYFNEEVIMFAHFLKFGKKSSLLKRERGREDIYKLACELNLLPMDVIKDESLPARFGRKR